MTLVQRVWQVLQGPQDLRVQLDLQEVLETEATMSVSPDPDTGVRQILTIPAVTRMLTVFVFRENEAPLDRQAPWESEAKWGPRGLRGRKVLQECKECGARRATEGSLGSTVYLEQP